MPRFRVGVTRKNLFNVSAYFKRAIHDERLFEKTSSMENVRNINQAIEAFKALPEIEWNSVTKEVSLEEFRQALQCRVDEYVPPDKWQRCLMTLRQQHARKKHYLRHLDIPQNILSTVSILAEKLNL